MDIDQAASAFEGVLNSKTVKAGADETSDGPVESIFDGMGEIEGDEIAGGDEMEDVDGANVEDVPPEDDTGEKEEGEEEGEEEKEGEEEEDEDKAGSLDLEQKVEVRVDGNPVEVSLGEALSGYIRLETFHRRLNYLNEVNTNLNTRSAEVDASREKYVGLISEAEDLLKALVPKEPDWDKLFAENPASARDLQKQYDGVKATLAELAARKNGVKQETDKEQARKTNEYARAEFSKFVNTNGFKDDKDLNTNVGMMRKTATALGFTEEEISQVYDSRMLNVLLKAAKYDRLVETTKGKTSKGGEPVVKKAVTNVSNGAGSARTAPKGSVGKATRSLARSGSIDDAARVFSNILKGK